MNKRILLLPLACAILTGCQDTHEDLFNDTSQKISFQVAKYRTSRADEKINGTKFEYDHFVTHAWSDASVAEGNVFMDHQKVVKTADGSAWMPERDYYWPNQSTVDFISYYPENVNKNCPVVEREKLTYTDYDVSGNKADINIATNDLMYAEKAVGYSGNINDVNDDNGGPHDSGYSGVPTLFHHALAQLEIRVLVQQPSGETQSHWEAVINHAKLDGYYTKGDLELTLKNPATTHGLSGWLPTGEEKVGWTLKEGATTTSQILAGTDSPITVSSTGSGEGYVTDTRGGCMSIFKAFVLPQTLTDQHRLELKFTLNKYRGEIHETSEADPDVRKILLKTDLIPYWGMNQKIVYTIIISPAGKISFDPAVVDWEDVLCDKSVDDVLRPTYYFAIPTDWEQSNVWHAYDAKGNNIAEVARELIVKSSKFYRSVVAYPSANEYANLSKGVIAQVSDMTQGSDAQVTQVTNQAGGTIAWGPRSEEDGSSYVRSLTMGTAADYQYVVVAPDGNVTLSRDIPAEAEVASVKPYTVTDIDGNTYPVVKIAATYWLRENLRVTRFNDGTPLTQRRTIADISTIANNDIPEPFTIYLPETVPTYDWYSDGTFDAAASEATKKLYGLNYNLCAVAGGIANPAITNGPGAGNPWALISQQGDPALTRPATKQLAPKGWHISTMAAGTMFFTQNPVTFGNQLDDISYVDEYVRYEWRNLMSESTGRDLNKASWPVDEAHPITNLSGFSLNVVPALGQTNCSGINSYPFSVKFNNGQLQNSVLFMHGSLKLAPNNVYFWNFPNGICNDYCMYGQDWQLGSSFDFSSGLTDNQELAIESSSLSLPIRCVRN